MREMLAVIVFGAITYWIADLVLHRDEVGSYTAFCEGTLKKGKCTGKASAASKTFYKPAPDQQTVFYWIDDGAPGKLTECAVRDPKNWACGLSYDGNSPGEKMIDGKVSNNFLIADYEQPRKDAFYYVSWWEWWLLKTKEYWQ